MDLLIDLVHSYPHPPTHKIPPPPRPPETPHKPPPNTPQNKLQAKYRTTRGELASTAHELELAQARVLALEDRMATAQRAHLGWVLLPCGAVMWW